MVRRLSHLYQDRQQRMTRTETWRCPDKAACPKDARKETEVEASANSKTAQCCRQSRHNDTMALGQGAQTSVNPRGKS